MNLQVISCNHHVASVEFREQLACNAAQTREYLIEFSNGFPQCEAVLLSTCNRTEWYVASEDVSELPDHDELSCFVAKLHSVAGDSLDRNVSRYQDREAVEHLFRVTCSLDSMVVGESQIHAQVKQAYSEAARSATAATLMHHLFQEAMRVAKVVSQKTSIYRKRVSIPSVAIHDFAAQVFESFQDKTVLVLGAGEMAEEALVYLAELGAQHVLVANRSAERARVLAVRFNGEVVDWDERIAQLAKADLVVSATSASEAVVTMQQYQSIESARQQRPLFVLDLAIPRDIDPEINNRLNVYLYSIDDLKAQCERNRDERRNELPKAERVIGQETDRFFAELNRRTSGPTIKLLREQAQRTKESEYQRLMNRLDQLTESEKKDIEIAFDRLVNKILHPPLDSIRDQSKNGSVGSMVEALKRLFQLND